MTKKTTQSDWTIAAEEASHVAALEKEVASMRARLGLYESIKTIPSHVIPKYSPKKNGPEQGQAIAVALLSDCHWEERVDPKDVPGTYNMYNPAIAKKRAEQFAQRVVYITEAQRHLTPINDLCLAILGDLITGHLHDDNRESNYLSPLQAILLAMDLCNSIIGYLLEHGRFEKIIIPCIFGNHGRTTHKPRAKTAPETNLEFMLYQLLAKHWAKEPRITWHIAEGLLVYVDLYGQTCRFMHGDTVQYQGGTGGLYVPMHRALYRLNSTRNANISFFGHFHTACDLGFAVGNGSMIGPNAYGIMKNIPCEPPRQQYVLLDSKRGKGLVAGIYCDHLPEPKDIPKNPW